MTFFPINLTSQWVATVYNAGVSILLTFLLGRVMGPEAFGRYSYMLTLASLFFILQDGGFKTLLFREKTLSSPAMKGYGDRLFSWAVGNTLVMTLGGVVCVLLLPFEYGLGIVVAFLYFGLQAVANFISSILRGEGLFVREAKWQVMVRTLGALGILLGLFFVRAEPWVVFGGWFLGVLVSLFWAPISIGRPSFGGFGIREVRAACLGFMAIDAATVVYYRCDIILLEYLTGNSAEVGYYSAAYRFLEGVVLMAMPLRVVWFRKLRLVWEEKRFFEQQLLKMGLVMLGAAFLVAGVGAFFSREIVFFTFGPEYADSVALLPWLLVSLVFVLPNGVLTQGIVARNRERYYAFAAGGAALLNIGLNFVLIPEFGGMGAAWATIATEGFLAVFLLVGVRQRTDG